MTIENAKAVLEGHLKMARNLKDEYYALKEKAYAEGDQTTYQTAKGMYDFYKGKESAYENDLGLLNEIG